MGIGIGLEGVLEVLLLFAVRATDGCRLILGLTDYRQSSWTECALPFVTKSRIETFLALPYGNNFTAERFRTTARSSSRPESAPSNLLFSCRSRKTSLLHMGMTSLQIDTCDRVDGEGRILFLSRHFAVVLNDCTLSQGKQAHAASKNSFPTGK